MAGKNAVYKPGDSAAMVQTPAAMMLLNNIMGSSGSQQYNGGVPVGSMYSSPGGGPGGGMMNLPSQNQQRPQQGGGQRAGNMRGTAGQQWGQQVQGGLPRGGQQAASNVGQQQGAGFSGLYNQAQGGGQQKMPGQPSNMNMMANAQQNYAQQQQQAFAPNRMPPGPNISQPDPNAQFGKNAPKTGPVDLNALDMNSYALQAALRGDTVLGQTAGQDAMQQYWQQQAMGGAQNDFNTAMAPGQPGLMTAMGGSLGGYGQGGYGADGMPSDVFGTQVGEAYNTQSGLEAGIQGEMRNREQAGLAASQQQDNQYKQELMSNIESEASSTLANQLPEVAAQMEAAGLGRSGARGLASTQMGQQVLGQANRDKMSVLAQFADQQAGRSFQGQQNMMQRLGGADDSMLGRMANLGLGVTGEQTARINNESNVQQNARNQNMQQFLMNQQNQQTALANMGIAEQNQLSTDQARINAHYGAARQGYGDMFTLATGIQQQPINYASSGGGSNPFVTMGGQILGGAAQGLFSPQTGNNLDLPK